MSVLTAHNYIKQSKENEEIKDLKAEVKSFEDAFDELKCDIDKPNLENFTQLTNYIQCIQCKLETDEEEEDEDDNKDYEIEELKRHLDEACDDLNKTTKLIIENNEKDEKIEELKNEIQGWIEGDDTIEKLKEEIMKLQIIYEECKEDNDEMCRVLNEIYNCYYNEETEEWEEEEYEEEDEEEDDKKDEEIKKLKKEIIVEKTQSWLTEQSAVNPSYSTKDTLGYIKSICENKDVIKEVFDECENPFYYNIEKNEIMNGAEEDEDEDDEEEDEDPHDEEYGEDMREYYRKKEEMKILNDKYNKKFKNFQVSIDEDSDEEEYVCDKCIAKEEDDKNPIVYSMKKMSKNEEKSFCDEIVKNMLNEYSEDEEDDED
tara:strand:+ start:1491 stop:2609 length:1119 start_codon:yes stop_codon:yes gene_type:complete